VTSDDFSEGIASTSQIVFTTENWATPQIVNVTGVDDLIDDGNQNFTIVLGQTESSDAQYNNIDVDDVALVNIDDDTAGIILSKTVLETDENGSADEFNVSLSSQPTDAVILNIVTSNPEEVALSTLNVMFTPDNWNTRQSITVTGINDGLNDDDAPFSISIVASSAGDPNFNSLNSTTVSGNNISFIAPPIDETVDVISEAVPATIDESENDDILIDPEFIRQEIATEIGVNEVASQARRFFIANSSGEVSWDLDREISRSSFYRNVDLDEQIFLAQDDKGRLADEAALEFRNRNDFQLDSLWNTLDVLDEDIQNQSSMPQIAAGTVAVTSIFTAGYLTWLIRGGHLLLGLISALPAWSSLDMLAVLSQSDDDEGDEEGGSNSLESLVTSPNESSPETEIDNNPTQRIVDQPQHTVV
jgi:hypothetical protein